MNFSKNGNYYFWQIPTNFGQVGQLKAFINYFNKQEKRKGEFYKNKFEELISCTINDFGRIPTVQKDDDIEVDYDNLLYLLNFDTSKESKEFSEALVKFGLIRSNKENNCFFLSDYANYIGSQKRKSRKESKTKLQEDEKDKFDTLTPKQKRMYNAAKANGYAGTIDDFISGKDQDKINEYLKVDKDGKSKNKKNEPINLDQYENVDEDLDNDKSFFDEEGS